MKHHHQQTPVIVCLAHLGWDYLWQRPQHLLSRLAHTFPVLYINEPIIAPTATGEPETRPVANQNHLSAWQVVFPDTPDTYSRWRDHYRAQVEALLIQQGLVQRVDETLVPLQPLLLWFYTPIPVYLLDHLPASLVIYDVMDELANFKGAADDLRAREARLLARADVVFAGGRSLYEARRTRHTNLHLFQSGVELEHFAQALDPAFPVAAEIAELRGPVLGYYGALDERIDLSLIDFLAGHHPEWNLVMVGPVTKIEPELLPQHPNLFYPGMQPYERLPEFLKGFDICLMPFAMNEATRYISPTKMLEYMAAHKPIISTPVPDVVAHWSDVVRIADSPAAFADEVQAALDESLLARVARQSQAEERTARYTWDAIADAMQYQIEQALATSATDTRLIPANA